ncbi:MAG TPA: DMT family transporter [Kofleriaceae bacterium]|nr:DMT family transporter [Kofleriaceae bacterium]
MTAYALVLVSAFLHAAWNALVKRSPDPSSAVHAVVAAAGVFAAGVALVECTMGGGVTLTARAAMLGAVAGALEAGYFQALGRALAAGPLGPVYTISRGTAAILVWPISIIALGERLTLLSGAGSALVLVGLAASSLERGASRTAVLWAVGTAAFIAGYHFAYKGALLTDSSPSLIFLVSMVVALGVGLLLGGASYRSGLTAVVRAAPVATLGGGAICAAAFLLFMYALHRGGAGYVFTLRNTSVLWATALAFTIGDRPGHRQVAGALLVFAGAVLMGLG